MREFKDIDAVEAWLEPMDLPGFWFAVEPYELTLQPRDHCEQQIRSGEVDEGTVLDVLKYFARLELTRRLDLHWRMPTPWLKLVH